MAVQFIKFLKNDVKNIIDNLSDSLSDKSYVYFDNLFSIHLNKRNLCISNHYEPYCYLPNFPYVERLDNNKKHAASKYNQYIYETYYKTSYFYNQNATDNYNFYIYKNFFLPFFINIEQYHTNPIKHVFNSYLNNQVKELQTEWLEKFKIAEKTMGDNDELIILTSYNRLKDDPEIVNEVLYQCYISNKNKTNIELKTSTGFLDNKTIWFLEEESINALKKEMNLFFNINSKIQDFYNFEILDKLFKITERDDFSLVESISEILAQLNKNNAFLDFQINKVLSLIKMSNSSKTIKNEIFGETYHKTSNKEETQMIQNIYKIELIYPFHRKNDIKKFLKTAESIKQKVLTLKLQKTEQIKIEKIEPEKKWIQSFSNWFKSIGFINSNKENVNNEIFEPSINPILVNHNNIMSIIFRPECEPYFSNNDLDTMVKVHEYINNNNMSNELSATYQLFLEQLSNYINLDVDYAQTYDFSKFIQIIDKKVNDEIESKNKNILKGLEINYKVLDKL